MMSYRATIILNGITVAFATIGFSLFALIGIITNDLNFGWIGFYLALSSMGVGNLSAAQSSRIRAEHYNALSDKLNAIASRQEDLIALVQGSSKHSETSDSDAETNSTEIAETADSR